LQTQYYYYGCSINTTDFRRKSTCWWVIVCSNLAA